MNRFSWFTTQNGRKFIFGSVTAGAVATVSFIYLPNTLFIDKYQEIVQCYSDGFPRETPDKVLNCFDTAVQILSIPESTKKLLKPFTVVGCDLFNAGSTHSRFGAIIGIPVNYGYLSADGIDKREIVVRQKSVDWESESGKKLASSLVLTDDEKIFGIAREILTAQTLKKLLLMLYPPSFVLFCYGLTTNLNRKLNLFAKPVQVRGIMYTLAIAYSYSCYIFAKDYTETYYEGVVDEQLANIGPHMALTGVNFYNKILQRNIALREFIGDDSFTSYGNENFLIRQRRLPLTYRKEYFEKRCKEYEENLAQEA
ncbi:transmembrane protein 177 isoform X2 [Ctenocephalides felis]|uniref:transmembrane protein 177 isoform X2 n=1 Tax=Ctenocephalides felis TaxID=7515 RepID=UPI000E6E57C3|nr:transmembrane protein 177 isoform X2 [Ctenocephalides felis]